jgi:hypothetical protein
VGHGTTIQVVSCASGGRDAQAFAVIARARALREVERVDD